MSLLKKKTGARLGRAVQRTRGQCHVLSQREVTVSVFQRTTENYQPVGAISAAARDEIRRPDDIAMQENVEIIRFTPCRCQVEYPFRLRRLECHIDAGGVRQIGRVECESIAQLGKAPQIATRPHERMHLMAVIKQTPYQTGGHESARPGYQDTAKGDGRGWAQQGRRHGVAVFSPSM